MSRIEEEKNTVGMMVRLYCRHYEKNTELCSDCAELLKYANERLTKCNLERINQRARSALFIATNPICASA